jgi:pilus assembly protein CpaE
MSEKILVVDDDLDSLKLIGMMLQRQGYEVIAANTGAQAIAKAGHESPDLVILDVMMPDMDGLEVCRRLRANAATRPIPIIMFTAKTLIDDKVAGFEAGADDYLTKPTHPAELSARIKSVLGRGVTREKKTPNRGKSIAVIGAKGGIGTTTIALNVAAALTKNGGRPILTDFRLGMGTLGLMLGHEDNCGLANVLALPTGEIRPPAVEKELVSHTSGLRALLSSTRAKEAQLTYTNEAALNVARSLATLGNPVVFDLGTGYTGVNSRLLGETSRILLLVEPVSATLRAAQELLYVLRSEIQKRVDVVVVNRSQHKLQVPWHEVEERLNQEILAIVAAAPEAAFQAAEAHNPIVLFQPTAIISSQIIKLAEDVNA